MLCNVMDRNILLKLLWNEVVIWSIGFYFCFNIDIFGILFLLVVILINFKGIFLFFLYMYVLVL